MSGRVSSNDLSKRDRFQRGLETTRDLEGADLSYSRYPKYKNSGVEWLGEVPEHWEVKRLKHIADVRLSNVDKHTVEGQKVVRLCNYLDVYNNRHITSKIDFMSATASDQQIERKYFEVNSVGNSP